MKKINIKTVAFTAFLFCVVGVSSVSAQSTTTDQQEEGVATTTESNSVATSSIEETDLTEEEIEEIVIDIEILEESDIESIEELEGEVVIVTDDSVVVERSDGTFMEISKNVYEKVSGEGSIAIGGYLNRKVVVAPLVVTGSSRTVTSGTSGSRTYTVPNSTPIISSSDSSDLQTAGDLNDGEEVAVIVNEDGEVVALELLSQGQTQGQDQDQENETGDSVTVIVFGVLVALIVIWILIKMTKKKKRGIIDMDRE